MVFKKESIIERLEKLKEILEILKENQEFTLEEYLKNKFFKLSVERGLALVAEIIIDILSHLLSSKYSVFCDTYEEVIEKGWENKIISDELYKELKGLGSFRNILIHFYLRIDDAIVYKNWKRVLKIYPVFIKEILDFIERKI